MAVATVRSAFQAMACSEPHGTASHPALAALPLLVRSIEHANACMLDAASRNASWTGMGTTFTGLVVLENRLAVAHVGDSRAYLLRGGSLTQLTADHTLLAEYLRAGVKPRVEAIPSMRHILTRALGTHDTVAVDSRALEVESGDVVLLASDGLHGVADDAVIASVLLRERDLTRTATRLIEYANDAGGPDNITVVLVRVLGA